MRKSQKQMQGVYQKRGFWYARIGGREEYFGKGDEAQKLAEAAKAKEIVQKFETKGVQVGLSSKRPEFKIFGQMCNWYMTLPSIQGQDGYSRKVYASKHLLSYFGNTSIYKIESEQQERFRAQRLSEGVGHHTINFEIQLLRAVYHKARKNKKISADIIPGEFVFKKYKNPRPIVPDDVFEKMVAKTDNDFKGVLICGFESAMRASEIAELTAGQVHLDEIAILNGQKQNLDYIDLGIFDTKNKTDPFSLCNQEKSPD